MAQTISVPGVGDLEFPDDMSQADMAAAIQKNFPQIHSSGPKPIASPQSNIVQGQYDDVPVLNAPPIQKTPTPAPSLADRAIGATEAGISSTIGGLAGFGGQIYGSVKGIGRSVLDGTYGTNAGANAAEEEAAKYQDLGASMFSPSTQVGQKYIKNVGEFAAPLAGLTPFTQEAAIIGRSARAAVPQATNAYNALSGNNKNRDIAERLAKNTGDKDLARFRLDAPQQGGVGLDYQKPEIDNDLKMQNMKESVGATDLKNGKIASAALAPEQRLQVGKAVKDELAVNAIRQGYDEGLIASIAAKNPETKRAALKMVNISEQGKKNRDFAINNRPSDVAGDQLISRVRHIQNVNSRAGKSLDKVADSLKNEEFDASEPVNSLLDDLNESGVKLDKDNNPTYGGSDFEGDEASQKILNILISRMKNTKTPNAYDVHRIKRFIDNKVTYGQTKEGLTGDAERIVKKFRANIDSALDKKFPAYDEVNTQYSDSIRALNAFQDAVGGKIDLNGVNAGSAVGTRTRSLMSNAQGRISLKDAMRNVDEIAKKYGGEFKEDITALADFADELDRVHGAHASTSLLGDMEKGTATGIKNAQRELGQMTIPGAVLMGGAKAYDYVRRVTPESKYKSIRDLLARDAQKEAKK